MTEVGRTQFKSNTTTLYPDNTSGEISPADLRAQMNDIADSATFRITNRTGAPGATDDGVGTSGSGTFDPGDMWIDETNDVAYICLDNTTSSAVWEAAAGGPFAISISGTPVANQLAYWSSGTEVEGDSNLTWDGSTFDITGDLFVVGQFDIDNININGNTISSTDTDGDINLTPDGTGEVVLSTAQISDLVSGRVLLSGTGGAIEENANLTFDGTTLTVTGAVAVDNISVYGNDIVSSDTDGDINLIPDGTGKVVLTTAQVSDLTSGRVVYASTSGALVDDAQFLYDGNHLTVPSIKVSDLTSGRVAITGTDGSIEDSGNLTFDGSTLTVTGDLSVSGEFLVDPEILNITASRALALTDAKDILEIDTTSASVDISIPTNASVAFPVGTVIYITLLTISNAATLTASAGVTLNGVGAGSGTITSSAYSTVRLYKRATDAWVVSGDIGAIA